MPIPQPKKGEKDSDFVSRCMGNATMVKEFPDKDQRAAICYSQVKNNRMFTFEAELGELRTASFRNEEHLVVPIVALQEQVLHSANAPEPELALASEFEKSAPSWNGRPVVVDHPVLNGAMVSANLPSVLEIEQVGTIFNTRVEDKKLKFDAWINLARAEEAGGRIKDTVDKLQAGEMVEVSTGLFADVDVIPGVFNNKEYAGIWRNISPDHLALLSNGVGACSVADGCGANRVNAAACSCGTNCGGKCDTMTLLNIARKPVFSKVETIAPPELLVHLQEGQTLEDLSEGERTEIAQRSLLGRVDAENLRELSYLTVVNPNTGALNRALLENSLELVKTDENLSEEAKKSAEFTIKGLLEQNFGGDSDKGGEKGGLWSKIMTLLRGNGELSDQDRRNALQAALDTSTAEDWRYVLAVFSDKFIFESWDGLFSQEYSISEDGTVSLGDSVVAVRPQTDFVPVKVQQSPSEDDTDNLNEDGTMGKEELVASLIDNQATRFSTDDREFLEGLEVEQLEKLQPVEAAASEETSEAAPVSTPEPTNNSAKPATPEEYLAAAPEEVRAVLTQGLKMQKQHRANLIETIKGNSRNKFSDAQLQTFGLEELENLAELAGGVADYFGNGGPRTPVANTAKDAVPLMPKVIEVGKANAA